MLEYIENIKFSNFPYGEQNITWNYGPYLKFSYNVQHYMYFGNVKFVNIKIQFPYIVRRAMKFIYQNFTNKISLNLPQRLCKTQKYIGTCVSIF